MVVKPVEGLGGDGGFIPLMIGLSLAERLIKQKAKQDKRLRKEKSFEEYGEVLFEIPKDIFAPFWDMYRNGLMHHAQPFSGKFSEHNKTYWDWHICRTYTARPEIIESGEKKIITICPWKWLNLVVSVYDKYPDLMNDLPCMKLGMTHNESETFVLPRPESQSPSPLPTPPISLRGTGSCYDPPEKT